MIPVGSKVLLNVFEQGAIRVKNPNANSKSELKKVKNLKILYRETPDGSRFISYNNGKNWKKMQENEPLPRGYYESKHWYRPPKYYNVVHKTIINENAVAFFISEEGRISSISKNHWQRMSDEQRLEANLVVTADNKYFEYKIIE